MAGIDVVGFLPAPPSKAYAGAADILESAFAYAVATSICVYEVHKLNIACTLHGGHSAPVTAIKWCPTYHSRNFAEPSHLRLASGDSDGGVVVWDVLSASQLLRLQDIPAAADLLRDYTAAAGRPDRDSSSSSAAAGGSAGPSSSGITSLAWVMPGSSVLAVVVAPALLLLWDVAGGMLLWKRELGSGAELYSQLAVAPLDSRQLCLCGSSGALVVAQLADPARDKVALQQYRVNTQAAEGKAPAGSSTLHALFPVAPGLLVLLLPRELLLFDLDLGQPAASTPLPSSMAAFSHLLGVFGSGVCQGGGDEGGLDFVYAAHVDGGLSVWVRVPGALRFRLGSSSRLTPAPLRGAASQVSLAIIKACLWRGHAAAAGGQAACAQTAASTAAITDQLNRSLAAMHLTTRDAGASTTVGSRSRADGAVPGSPGGARTASSSSSSSCNAAILSGHCLLVMAVTYDGRLWQWQVPLPRYPRRSFLAEGDEPIAAMHSSIQAARAAAVPATVMPQLVGLLHGLPGSITATSLQPRPLLLPSHLAALASSIASSCRRPSQYAASSQRPSSPNDDPFAELAAAAGRQQQQQQQQASSTAADASTTEAPTAAAREAEPDSSSEANTNQAQDPAECVVLGAAATSTGHLQVISLRRGHVTPLAVEVAGCHAAHKDAVRGVRWLGSSPLLVSFSSEKSSSGGWRNSLLLTDVRTGRSLSFRDGGGSESSPMLGLRISPSGAYLLLLLKGAPAELWTTLPSAAPAAAAAAGSAPPSQPSSRTPSRLGLSAAVPDAAGGAAAAAGVLGGGGGDAAAACLVKPWRVRLVDLPFSAVEWVAAEEELQKGLFNVWATSNELQAAAAAADIGAASPPPGDAAVFERSLSRQASWGFNRALSVLAAPSMSAAAAGPEAFPSEMLAFALADGRSGVLSVRGRKVTDVRPKRPSSSPGPGDSVGSALAAVWPLLVQGDADGVLLSWDLATGHCSSLPTGCGVVRRILLAPASPPVLSGAVDAVLAGTPAAAAAGAAGSERMRAAVLFASGSFGVFDLDGAGRLRPSAASPASCVKFGRALDISWLSLPGAAGAGSVLAVVLEDGSLSLLDVAQCQARRPGDVRARQALLQQVLRTASPAQLEGVPGGRLHMPVVLLPPRPLGSSMLLQQPWVLLLRSLLQLGVSQNALLYISSSSTEEDDDVRLELQQLLPRSARAVLAHIAAAGPGSLSTLQQQQQQRFASSRIPAAGRINAVAAAGSSSSKPQSPLAKARSSPLIKSALGSGNLFAALQGGASTRSLAAAAAAAAAAARPGSGGSGSSQGEGAGAADASAQQQQQQQRLAALGFGVERFDGDLVKLLRCIAKLRGNGQLLHTDEWKAYTEALTSGLVARRMAVAARLSGQQEEARFWSALPATLQRSVKAMHSAIQAAQQQQQQQQQQASAAATPTAAASAAAGTISGDMAPAAALAPGVDGDTGAGGITPQGSQALAGTDAAADLDSLDDYDRMVQQALDGPHSSASSATLSRAAAAAVGQQAGSSPSSSSPLNQQQQGLGRRSSGTRVVPGHVRLTSSSSSSAARGDPPQFSARGGIRVAAAGRPVLLWDEELVLSDAQERLLWHEALPGQLWEGEGLLERRLLGYVALGDFSTAVAFLLSTAPESSVRYYRSVVCALALAATASLRAQTVPGSSNQAAATLHLQAAKVVSAHAASIGDTLLGVPLNCSAGLNADAVQLLQEAGMWQLAASLTARTLTGTERAQALCRWAGHVLLQDGSVWRCVGILTSAGCLSAAVQVLRTAGLPDCAEAYVLACKQAGLLVKSAAPAQQQQQQQPEAGSASEPLISWGDADFSDDEHAADGTSKQQLQQQQPAAESVELFDLLGPRSRLLPWLRSSGAAADREGLTGADELRLVTSEYHNYLCTLLASL